MPVIGCTEKDKTLNSLDGHPAETQGGYVPCWSNPSGVMFFIYA